MLSFFRQHWFSVPTVWIDTETTGKTPGIDRAVSIGIVRFEAGAPAGEFSSLVYPGRPISEEAAAIHGITDAQVESAPPIAEVFAFAEVKRLLDGAQPAAYNGPFDRHFVPPFGDDWAWPWLDALSLVRAVDQFVRGKGRHRLENVVARHGITPGKAHDALSDARAAALVFYKLAPPQYRSKTLGEVLHEQRLSEADDWFRFNAWLSKQPPQEAADVAHG